MPPSFGKELRKDFLFDEDYLNLNHGSFGTYPRQIRTSLREFQDASEARPDQFIRYDYPRHLDASRASIATILKAPVETVVFVQNATTGTNTVLRSLVFKPGEVIVYFATIYGACEKTVQYITETTPAEAIKIEYAYPISDDALLQAFEKTVREQQKAGKTVKIAIFDTVVSLPGVRMPFERLTVACKNFGILSCVDAAHAVGHISLDLAALDCDFFVSNCHKWLFVPRGCAVLYVPVRNQNLIPSTLPTSHGYTPSSQTGAAITNPLPSADTKAPYVINFQFVGTLDNSPYLCVPVAVAYRESLGGEKAIRAYCFDLARKGGEAVASRLGTRVLENEAGTLGNCCFSNVALPLTVTEVEQIAAHGGQKVAQLGIKVRDWMTGIMVGEYATFMALIFYENEWWVRLSAQVYLELEDFERGAEILAKLCGRVKKGEFLE